MSGPLFDGHEGDRYTAPYLVVPSERIVAVEHPCIIKNVDKASEMLGGSKAIAGTLDYGSTKTLGLKFDPSGKDVMSLNNKTDNVLLRVTVPKIIGKRKRGSEDPFQAVLQDDLHPDARSVLRSMQDNPEATIVSPLGTIENNHIFRSIPDFAYLTSTSFFKHDVKTKLFSQDHDIIRQFQLPSTYGAHDTEVLPPPVLSTISLPQYYSYVDKQSTKPSPSVKPDENMAVMAVHDLDAEWPASPPASVTRPKSKPKRLQSLIDEVTKLFENRPIWTRRALINSLSHDAPVTHLRRALSGVAFFVRNGPWRDTLCRFGIDPRRNPEFGRYQVVHLRLDVLTGRQLGWSRSRNPTDHLYTGTENAQQYDNRLFQLCDLSDPLLVPLVARATRSECDPVHYGWYQNGTFSKISTILRAKFQASIYGTPTIDFSEVLALPDHFDFIAGDTHPATSENPAYLPETSSDLAKDLATEYRQTIRNAENKRTKRLESYSTGNPTPVDDGSPVPASSAPRPLFESAWDSRA